MGLAHGLTLMFAASALSVALTNLSLEYPGLGFMQNDDGNTWKILMPDDIRIPVSGGFGIDEK